MRPVLNMADNNILTYIIFSHSDIVFHPSKISYQHHYIISVLHLGGNHRCINKLYLNITIKKIQCCIICVGILCSMRHRKMCCEMPGNVSMFNC